MKNRRHAFLLPALAAFLLSALSCREKEVLVNYIDIQPASVEILVGDFAKFTVKTYPHFADNEYDLECSVTRPEAALCKGSSITGLKEGAGDFVATCGDVSASRPFRVYRWPITLDGKDYGVSRAEATFYRRGKATPQELEIRLVHEGLDGSTHHFEVRIPVEDINQIVDFMEPGQGASALAYPSETKEGLAVYRNLNGVPTVCLADWSATEGIRLISGLLTVDETGTNQYRLKGKFSFTNGYSFKAEWEGKVSPVYE